jgi:hypothetical protein
MMARRFPGDPGLGGTGIYFPKPAWSGAGSIAFFVNKNVPDSDTTFKYVFDTDLPGRYLLFKNTDNTYTWWINGTQITATLANLILGTSWHHLVFTWDDALGSQNQKIFRNGSLFATFSLTVGSSTTGLWFYMGERFHAEAHWAGDLAEFAVWNVALNQNEITALASGLCPLLIRPGAQTSYHPLIGDGANPDVEMNLCGHALGTTTIQQADGPVTIVAHPPTARALVGYARL